MYYANFNCKYLKDCTVKFTVTYTSIRPVPSVVLLPCQTQMNLAQQWHDDSTAAVSNVEPNTVAPNSKDKTNHPSSSITPSKMAEGNRSEEREKFGLFKTILNTRRQCR